jgi:hypothetical protein
MDVVAVPSGSQDAPVGQSLELGGHRLRAHPNPSGQLTHA